MKGEDVVVQQACRFCMKKAPSAVISAADWKIVQSVRHLFRGKNTCKACCLSRGIPTEAAFDK